VVEISQYCGSVDVDFLPIIYRFLKDVAVIQEDKENNPKYTGFLYQTWHSHDQENKIATVTVMFEKHQNPSLSPEITKLTDVLLSSIVELTQREQLTARETVEIAMTIIGKIQDQFLVNVI